MQVDRDFCYIFIGGAAKAGTTSLFKYLSDHPEVCGAIIKETGFFLDDDFPSTYPRKINYKDGINEFYNYFLDCKNAKFRLEATPTYLYSSGTPERIRSSSFSRIQWIFILREPISRLVSCYRFFMQIGKLDKDTSFREYVEKQFEFGEWAGSRCLVTGKYSIYLSRFFGLFPRKDIQIINFEQLNHKPIEVLKRISKNIGIDPSYYDTYEFKIVNPTITVKRRWLHNLYVGISQRFSHRYFLNNPEIRSFIRSLRKFGEPIYLRINQEQNESVEIPYDLFNRLEEYYLPEKEALSQLLSIENFDWDFQIQQETFD